MADPAPTGGAVQVLHQLRELWGRQPKRRKMLAIIVLLGVLAVVGWSTLAHHPDAWTVVGDGASPDDTHELYASLQASDIPARLREGKIEVPSERADEARIVAASAGLPHAGKGFELFDESNLGQSSFAEQVNYRRALQGELARSIAALAQVERARVHLALGKHSVFKDQEEAPSASVALHLHANQQLTNDQVRGVRQLVAASVEGLKAEAVVIVDSHGNLLEAGDPTSADRKADLEHTITMRVRTMLERVVGANKVSVVTTADVDYRKISQTEDLYDRDHEAMRSETRSVEGPDATAGIGGVAGARGNLPGSPGGSATGGGSGTQKLQETKNYEVSHTVRQTVNPDTQLQRLHLAVVVDYKTDKDGKPVPRTAEELAELTAVARQAAGIDDARGDKIEVHSIPFVADADQLAAAAPPIVATSELPILPLAIGGGAAVLVGITLVMLRARRRRARKASAMPMSLALPAPIGELERALDARPSAGQLGHSELPGLPAGRPIQERVLDVVRADVERTAGLLTAWLAEPAPKGIKS